MMENIQIHIDDYCWKTFDNIVEIIIKNWLRYATICYRYLNNFNSKTVTIILLCITWGLLDLINSRITYEKV